MVKFTWYDAEVPEGMKVRQVQGLIFTRDGRLLIKSEIIDGKKVYSLGTDLSEWSKLVGYPDHAILYGDLYL